MKKYSKHTKISFLKSAVRIIAFLSILDNLLMAALLLCLAEVIGIYEEFYA
jgi:hypothetical protein